MGTESRYASRICPAGLLGPRLFIHDETTTLRPHQCTLRHEHDARLPPRSPLGRFPAGAEGHGSRARPGDVSAPSERAPLLQPRRTGSSPASTSSSPSAPPARSGRSSSSSTRAGTRSPPWASSGTPRRASTTLGGCRAPAPPRSRTRRAPRRRACGRTSPASSGASRTTPASSAGCASPS